MKNPSRRIIRRTRVHLTPMESFKQRVARWAAKLRAPPREVLVLRMTRKWASCSTRGRVCFARDLLERPAREQDYVIAHELLHLRHPNHGRVFHALLSAHLPSWRMVHLSLQKSARALSSQTPAQ